MIDELLADVKLFGWGRAIRREEHRQLKVEFLRRQKFLAASAAVELVFHAASGSGLLLVLALLLVQAGQVEALRFRNDGRWWQTKRAIWRGATQVDARALERGLA